MILAIVAAVSACGGDAVDDGAARVELSGKQESFEPHDAVAPAGKVAIVFRNEEQILHNVRVFDGADADGELVGKTGVKRGPRTDTLRLDLAPGTYFFDCEIHPQSMRGTLRVR
jgi:plastocyanin